MLFGCKYYDQMRIRWMRSCEGLDEKERSLDVINGYVERTTMRYI